MEKAERAYELGFKYEANYGGCAQAALAAIFDVVGVEAEDVFRSATGLAGGIGLSTEGTCDVAKPWTILFGILLKSIFVTEPNNELSPFSTR